MPIVVAIAAAAAAVVAIVALGIDAAAIRIAVFAAVAAAMQRSWPMLHLQMKSKLHFHSQISDRLLLLPGPPIVRIDAAGAVDIPSEKGGFLHLRLQYCCCC